MKEDILKLRNEGKTYNEIKEILGCSKGTISYHCGKDQKEKTKKRTSKRRENSLIVKTSNFIYRNKKECIRKFQKREIGSNINKEIKTTFTWLDVIEKYRENNFCYLSGVEIDLNSKDCHFDHIIPVSRGGGNDINNLGITHKIVNLMKSDLMVDELIDWCIKIVENNGYQITKK